MSGGVQGKGWGQPRARACRYRDPYWLPARSALQLSLPFPEEGLVYDYRLDDAGISNLNEEEDDDEDVKKVMGVL